MLPDATKQLNNTKNYRPLPNDLTKINNDPVNKGIKKISKKHLIKEKLAERLVIQNPKTPRFYTKPKIHKEKISGRPFISSVNCHNFKIWEYVDYHLQTIVREIASYIKDATDFFVS